MSPAAKPAAVRFYVDADVLGLAKILIQVRNDVTYPGDPGGVLHKRQRAPCPITSPAVLDPVWIPEVTGYGWLIITRDSNIADNRAEISAVRMSGARMVALAGSEAIGTWNQLEVLMCQWRAIEARLAEPGPFIYSATRTRLPTTCCRPALTNCGHAGKRQRPTMRAAADTSYGRGMSRKPLTEDAIEDLESGSGNHEQSAATLEAWADDPHPDDEVSRGRLLVAAGEHRDFARQPAAALSLFRQAVATGDHVEPDVRCYLVGALYEAGLGAEADDVIQQVKADRPREPLVYDYIGGVFEMAERWEEATTWYTMGVLRAMRFAEHDPRHFGAVASLLHGRRRVREAQGFPPDEDDERSMAIASQLEDFSSR